MGQFLSSNGRDGAPFPEPRKRVWKAWKARPLWRRKSKNSRTWRGCGRCLHKTEREYTGGSGRVVESVGKERPSRGKSRGFSSCTNLHRPVLENRDRRQDDAFQVVERVIHFSVVHYGYYESCKYTFSKNKAYPSHSFIQQRSPFGSPDRHACAYFSGTWYAESRFAARFPRWRLRKR